MIQKHNESHVAQESNHTVLSINIQGREELNAHGDESHVAHARAHESESNRKANMILSVSCFCFDVVYALVVKHVNGNLFVY